MEVKCTSETLMTFQQSTFTAVSVSTLKQNRSEMVAVLGPYEALPYCIHTYLNPQEAMCGEGERFEKEAVVLQVNIHSFIHQWLYSPLLGPGLFFSFVPFLHSR
jgi:hypothetical protein